MRYAKTGLIVWMLMASVAVVSMADDGRMTPELLWKLGRVSGGAVSRDGQQVAYTVRNYKLEENAGSSAIHLLTLEGGNDDVIGEPWKSVSDLQWGNGASAGHLFCVGTPSDIEDAKPQVWSINPNQSDPRHLQRRLYIRWDTD